MVKFQRLYIENRKRHAAWELDVLLSSVLYSLHTSIEFWNIFIHTYHAPITHNIIMLWIWYNTILHIMTSFGIQPPGPSRFLHAVFKSRWTCTSVVDFWELRISGFGNLSGLKASGLSSECLSVVAFGELQPWNLAHYLWGQLVSKFIYSCSLNSTEYC